MVLTRPPINVLTICLLVLQLWLPVTMSAVFLEAVRTNNSGVVCPHAEADADHESQESHPHITLCHELEGPCDITAGYVMDPRAGFTPATSTGTGVLLAGYRAPFDIPPEYCS